MKRTTTPYFFSRNEVDGDRYPPPSNHHRPTVQNSKASIMPHDARGQTARLLRAFSDFAYPDHRPIPVSLASKDSSLMTPFLPTAITLSTPKLETSGRQPSWRPMFRRLSESPIFWLGMYFMSNLSLTLYNKSVLIEFPFPWTLTALHSLCSAAGATVLVRVSPSTQQGSRLPALNSREITALVLFSILFTVNIAVSNISLDLVTVPFHQTVRATTPVFTLILSWILLGSRSSRGKVVALIPVIVGVSVATYGDYYFSWWGLILTLLGTVLSALKTIITHILQTSGSHNSKHTYSRFASFLQPRPTLSTLSPIQILRLLAPLAFMQSLFLAYLTGELGAMYRFTIYQLQFRHRVLLIIDGLLAFGLNVTSFGANKRVGALTMTVAGNVKQVLTMLLAVLVFNLRITPPNAIGILITLLGGAWYTTVDMQEKERAKSMRECLPVSSPTTTVFEKSEA